LEEQLIKLHQKIYRYTKKRANKLFEEPTPLLKKYQRDQKRYSKRSFKFTQLKTLLKNLDSSQIIFLGDFHTLDQNSRNFERILNSLLQLKDKKLILGLEIVHAQNQEFIDAFLNEDLTELEFLESVQYENSWQFPWSHYKNLFQVAKNNQLQIFGLNSHGDLRERDKFAAQKIYEIKKNDPDSILLILFGELHIVPNKIPHDTSVLFEKNSKNIPKITIIHQNLDSITNKQNSFWNFKEKILQFSDNEYSLQNTPPWVKYESLIQWYENFNEDPDFDFHEIVIKKGYRIMGEDAQSNFIFISREILKFLNPQYLDVSNKELVNYHILDMGKINQCSKKINQIKKYNLKKFYTYLLTSGEMFLIPSSNDYYIGHYGLNRFCSLVGHHIMKIIYNYHFQYGANNQHQYNYIDQLIIKYRPSPYKFLYFTQLQILAYLSSKIINPFKKCELYLNLKGNHEDCLKIIDEKFSIKRHLEKYSLEKIYQSGKIVGNFLGEFLYSRLAHKKLSEQEKEILILQLMSPWTEEEIFLKVKKKILQNTNYKKSKKNLF
jgi:hypothetical protein